MVVDSMRGMLSWQLTRVMTRGRAPADAEPAIAHSTHTPSDRTQ